MNLKVKYNAFMAEHPLLRGGAWLITKLFMLTLVAILIVIEFLCRVISGSSKEQAEDYERYGDESDKFAKEAGFLDYQHYSNHTNDE